MKHRGFDDPATARAYDKWRAAAEPFVELTDHEEWCECHIDGDENDCNCPERAGLWEEEYEYRWDEPDD